MQPAVGCHYFPPGLQIKLLLPFNGYFFPGGSGRLSLLSPRPLAVPQENFCGLVERVFLQAGCLSCHPTINVKGLKVDLVTMIITCMMFMVLSSWHGGATGRALDLQSTGRGFKSYSGQKLRNNLGQVVHTYVSLSPSSITWYWPRGGDAVRLGR